MSVLLNNGDGTFAPGVIYDAGDLPAAVALADLDGDADQDLAVANAGSDNISVLLNNGDGTFAPGTIYDAGHGPTSVVTGDLDGDRDLDLAVANAFDNTVAVLFNNGNGTFHRPDPWRRRDPSLNGAGRPGWRRGPGSRRRQCVERRCFGLAQPRGRHVSPQVVYGAGVSPSWLAAGDLDGDLDLDLAVANGQSDDVQILLNNGDGTFESPVAYGAGNAPKFVALDDLGGSQCLDMAVANEDGGNVSILLNACEPTCPGDTNGDGAVDVRDLNSVILDWGSDGTAHGGDVAGPVFGGPPDGIVNVSDLNAVIIGWGTCQSSRR